MTGTIAGTPVYIAPEVFQSDLYNSKADIYSLGIILWEVWYGEQAFAKINITSLKQFFGMVENGLRPQPLKGCSEPPKCWQDLMSQCWNETPEKRPSATECLEKISRLGDQFC